MSLRKAVFVALICAGFVYAAFWSLYLVCGIVAAAGRGGKLLTAKARARSEAAGASGVG
jgi:hypothetical protein